MILCTFVDLLYIHIYVDTDVQKSIGIIAYTRLIWIRIYEGIATVYSFPIDQTKCAAKKKTHTENKEQKKIINDNDPIYNIQ